MAVDSIGGPGSRDSGYDTRRRTLEEAHARELERIEEKHRDAVAKAEEAREHHLTSIYESQGEEIEDRRHASDDKIAKVKADADARIRSFEADSQRMTEEAKRQFQAKADVLAKNSREFEEQRNFMLKQHGDTVRKLQEEREQVMTDHSNKLNREASQAYTRQQREVSKLQEKSEQELARMNEDILAQKDKARAEGVRELTNLKEERDQNAAAIQRQIDFYKRTSDEQMKHEKFGLEARQKAMDDEFKDQVSDLNHKGQRAINQAHIQGKHALAEAVETYPRQIHEAEKNAKQKVRDVQTYSGRVLQTLENDAKAQEHVARTGFENQKHLLEAERQKSLQNFSEQNSALQKKLSKEYETNAQNLLDERQKLLVGQREEYAKDIEYQRKLGQKQLNDVVLKNTDQISSHGRKSGDTFYQMQSINAQVSDNEREILIEVNVPEHEQDAIRLARQKNSLTLSGTRRAENQATLDNGHVAATHTYQSFSESFPAQGKLEWDRMTRTYQDGRLTFRIPKG